MTALLPSLVMIVLRKNDFVFNQERIRSDGATSWRFGRWVAISQLSHSAQGYVVHWVLAAFGGAAATGLYSACWSIVQLASPFVQGVGNAAGPLISRAFAESSTTSSRVVVRNTTMILTVVLVPYSIGILLIGDPAQRWLYQQQYEMPSWLPGLLAFAMTASAISMG